MKQADVKDKITWGDLRTLNNEKLFNKLDNRSIFKSSVLPFELSCKGKHVFYIIRKIDFEDYVKTYEENIRLKRKFDALVKVLDL